MWTLILRQHKKGTVGEMAFIQTQECPLKLEELRQKVLLF